MNQNHESITKHEQIIGHIESLKVGSKISVRRIAKELDVSEGTAYRAIKEAENRGLVSTKERIGTIRMEKKKRVNIDKLTFSEVVNIVDGHVLGGSAGLHKTLNKFVIGAMELEAMKRYIEPDSLLIVGNRYIAHGHALERGAGVLITGGFDTSEEVIKRADELDLPVISCSYDTFTVASMINRAIYDSLIKKKVMLVEDILPIGQDVAKVKSNETLTDWQTLVELTGHSRFPVVDDRNRVIGMVTSKDVVSSNPNQLIEKVMTRHPLTVNLQTPIASAAHMMVWEGIELLPVVDGNRKLIGVISRQDVLKAMQLIQRQPQHGETIEELIWIGFREQRDAEGNLYFSGMVTPQMTNHLGTVSEGVLTTIMTKAAYQAIQELKKGDLALENMSTYFVRPLQMESEIEIKTNIIEVSRKFGKVEVEIVHDQALIAKAMLTAQVIEH